MTSLWMSSAAVVAVALCPGAAFSQSGPASEVSPGDRITKLELDVSATYDSDVAASDAVLAAARHIKPADVIIAPQVRGEIARPIGRETVYLIGSAGYDVYTRNGFLSRENIALNPGVVGEFSRCQWDASGSYSRRQSQLLELAIGPTAQTTTAKNTIQISQVTGGAVCGHSVGLAPTLRVSQSWVRNSSTLQRSTDANSFSTQDGIAYRRPSFGSLTIFGSYATTSYPERNIITILLHLPDVIGGFNTYSAGITYTRPVGARLVGSASVSYTDLVNKSKGTKGFSGLTYSAALSYTATSRLSASINTVRATLPSNRVDSLFEIDELYAAEVDYRLTRRASFRLGGSYEHEMYGGSVNTQHFDLTDEKIYSGYLDGEYSFNRRLSALVEFRQAHRAANFPGLTYDDTRLTLGARATF